MQKFFTSRDEAVVLFKAFGLEDLIASAGIIQENELFEIDDGFALAFPPARSARHAAANRCTLYRILIHLAGRRSMILEFGADTTLDRVTIQTWCPDTCGCEVAEMFHRDKPDLPSIPIRSYAKCKGHAHLKGGHEGSADHYDAIKEENRVKNEGVAAVAAALDVPERDVDWKIESIGRVVTFKHPALKGTLGTTRRADLERKLAAIAGKRPVALG